MLFHLNSGCGELSCASCTDFWEVHLVNCFAVFHVIKPRLPLLYVAGTASIMNLVAVGYDRYNVICNGLAGTRIKYSHAMLVTLLIWAYSLAACIPPYFGWGAYKLGMCIPIQFSDTFLRYATNLQRDFSSLVLTST